MAIESDNERNDALPADPVMRARVVAIRIAGGNSMVARAIGLKNHESIRRWTINTDPKPEHARILVQLCGGVVTLSELLPSVYGGLTADELGYQPEAAKA